MVGWYCSANIYSNGSLAYIASNSGQNAVQAGQPHSGYVTMPQYSVIPSRQGYTLKGYSQSPGATSPSMYPGDDMWWTDDTQAVKNSVLRAISGGPVYVSDEIGRSRPEILRPLCFDDGRILRCDRSGMPTADCLIEDPRTSGKPFKVQNRIGKAGVVAAFHISENEGPLEGILSPSDVPGLEGEEFVVYEYFTENRHRIPKDGHLRFILSDQDDVRLFTLIPYENGFAPIGRTDKYLSYAAITAQIGERVTLYEPGPYAYDKDGAFYTEDFHE